MKKELYRNIFNNKKITIMGLGVLGRGLQVTKFLAECGAKITVTDLKSRKDLETSIKSLKKFKIKYVLGKHELKDFEKADMIIKSAGVPLDSPFIAEARKNNVPVHMDASLFAKVVSMLEPKVTIIGITGTRGKSMTTAITHHILKENEKKLGKKVFIGGNMRMKATLPLLNEISAGDIVVLELDSWQCQGFGDEKISPQIAVFTSFMPDHMNYYKDSMNDYLNDKSYIFKFQKLDDVLVTNKAVEKILDKKTGGKKILISKNKIRGVNMNIIGEHNTQNALYAFEVAKLFKLNDNQIKKTLKTFRGLEGRLEILPKVRGINIINDNNATTPQATVAGIEAVKSRFKNSNIILIAGGSDKKLPLDELILSIKKNCHQTILLSGTGTEKLEGSLHNYTEFSDFKKAVLHAFTVSKRNDVILFSPGFASFGLFIHEYDRNDQFLKIIKNLRLKWK